MEKQKLSGMEMMLNSLMKAAGFNPQEIQQQMAVVIGGFKNGLDALVGEVKAIREEQEKAKLQRELIMRDLSILKANAGIVEGVALISHDQFQTSKENSNA